MTRQLSARSIATIFTLLGSTSGALADTGAFGLTDQSGLKFYVNADIDFDTSSSASGAFSEASYTRDVEATTTAGGTTQTRLGDAFDGYGTISVNVADSDVWYNRNGAGTLRCNDREVQLNAQLISGLEVTRRIYVPSDDTFARQLTSLRNTTDASITASIKYWGNLGSDSNTTVDSSSSGDTTVDTEDLWAVSYQNYSGNTSNDPRIGHIFQGPAPRDASLAHVSLENSDDNPTWSFVVTLAPGQTKLLMHLVTGQPSRAAARAKAQDLVRPDNVNLRACMTPTEVAQVVNFTLGCITDVTENDACDDGDACTENDVCVLGACLGTPKNCRAEGTCTGVCDPESGSCVDESVPDGVSCGDENLCNGNEVCQAGACAPSAALDCDDQAPCTADACDTVTGCSHTLIDGCLACELDADCQDDDACNGTELCSEGTCKKGTPTPEACEPAGDGDGDGDGDGEQVSPAPKKKSSGCSVGSEGSTGAASALLLMLLGLAVPLRRLRRRN